MSICGILFPRGRCVLMDDEHGCLLPAGHFERHVFRNGDGVLIQWGTDHECDCRDCQSDEPDDWCIVYGQYQTKDIK